uniref:Uncharacterized protein n=1 Tax=viral metagenome TaxID=1070528 RepID=A0A6C0H5X7_9ZZZZ
MASTRNKNTAGNYGLQQRDYTLSRNHIMYKYGSGGYAVDPKIPGIGFGPAMIPSNELSYNAVDIESFLFGTNLTNLVNPQKPLNVALKNLPTANVFYYPKVYTSIPLPYDKDKHRPFPCP